MAMGRIGWRHNGILQHCQFSIESLPVSIRHQCIHLRQLTRMKVDYMDIWFFYGLMGCVSCCPGPTLRIRRLCVASSVSLWHVTLGHWHKGPSVQSTHKCLLKYLFQMLPLMSCQVLSMSLRIVLYLHCVCQVFLLVLSDFVGESAGRFAVCVHSCPSL